MGPVVAVLVVIVVLGLVPVALYNGLVRRRNAVDNIYGTLDAMLKKRWDLVPNLAATVKGYARHEYELLSRITQERARSAPERQDNDRRVAFDNQVSEALGRTLLVVENYPELKANESFLHLQRSLVELEEQISAARRAFNAAVTDYNNATETFPGSLVAGSCGFRRRELFAIDAVERGVVSVKEALS